MLTENILNDFKPIILKEMDKSELMNRTDAKFAFPLAVLPLILETVKNDYCILEIDNKRNRSYQTLYYDTKHLSLYLAHHNGKLNRYKIRHRIYTDSKQSYLEIKFKNNKNRTIKSRVKETEHNAQWSDKSRKFIEERTPFNAGELFPFVKIDYNRITLVNNSNAERITIDTNLQFTYEGVFKEMNGLVIAEIKQSGKNSSLFYNIMKKRGIRKISLSKYCLGIALANGSVKRNNFKHTLNSIKYIINAPHSANS